MGRSGTMKSMKHQSLENECVIVELSDSTCTEIHFVLESNLSAICRTCCILKMGLGCFLENDGTETMKTKAGHARHSRHH